jgi:hypothetical protein
MNKRGRRRMLLVLLLPWQASGNLRDRGIGPVVPESGRQVAPVLNERDKHKKALKSAEVFEPKVFSQALLPTAGVAAAMKTGDD